MFFASDNAAPAHPDVMAALTRANEGYAPAYGSDALMGEVTTMVREKFEAPEAAVYLVATGTTANVLSLATYAEPWHTIFCHEEAHIQMDEAGAPEFYTGGAKLTLLGGKDAKFDAATLRRAIESTNQGFVHSAQRGPVSITNSTECGAVYSQSEIIAISEVCKEFNLPLHMDGARFSNALAAQNISPADATWRAGVDVLSFGGTKNGLLGVEAVVMFDPKHAWEFELRRKRGGHLFSKHRYLSAQMHAYLVDDLWLRLARQANSAAQRLAEGILSVDGGALVHPCQANAVFASFPRAAHKRAMDAGAAYYLWPFDQSLDGPEGENLSARLMASYCTTDAEIDEFLSYIKG